jgi:hypothetical protein
MIPSPVEVYQNAGRAERAELKPSAMETKPAVQAKTSKHQPGAGSFASLMVFNEYRRILYQPSGAPG